MDGSNAKLICLQPVNDALEFPRKRSHSIASQIGALLAAISPKLRSVSLHSRYCFGVTPLVFARSRTVQAVLPSMRRLVRLLSGSPWSARGAAEGALCKLSTASRVPVWTVVRNARKPSPNQVSNDISSAPSAARAGSVAAESVGAYIEN